MRRRQSGSTTLRRRPASFATFRAIGALMLREIITTYGRSPGGYIWAVLEPAAGITLLTLVFSIGFRTPPLGTSFALFYAAGILPLMMYTDISAKLAQTIQFSRALLAYPRITFVDALLARFILNVLTQFVIQVLVIGFIFVVLKPTTVFDMGKVAQAYLLTLAFALGIGTLNSFLTVAYPIWHTAWSIVNRPLFLLSCVFFIFESVPQPYADYLWYNPMVHIAGLMRDGYYPFYQPTYVSIIYPLIVSALTMMSGLFLLYRYHRDVLDR